MRRAYEMGASDYVNRPFDSKVVYRRVHNTIKLYAKQSSLGQHGTTLFDLCNKVLRLIPLWKYDCLSAKCPNLGTPYIKDITESGKLRQGQIGCCAHQSVAEPCPIYIKRNLIFPAHLINIRQFLFRIQGSIFCGIRQIYHSRDYHMLMGGILIKIHQVILQVRCFHLPLICRK